MKWALNPISSIHSSADLRRPSTLHTLQRPRKFPKTRVYQEDQLKSFTEIDKIEGFDLIYRKSNVLLVIVSQDKKITLFIVNFVLMKKVNFHL